MSRKKVLITGAGGTIAGKVIPDLAKRFDLTLMDISPINREGNEIPNVIIADLLDRDRNAYREHFRGVDAIIHRGFVKSENWGKSFWA
ncbi:MAG: hypothetical protein HN368_18830, partial [Spirochaetales bacterium]|nr:hypothetical protein [Spirochaetales bacterium]